MIRSRLRSAASMSLVLGASIAVLPACEDSTGVSSSRPQLTVQNLGGGVVLSSPSGIDCGAACLSSFDTGTPVTLIAAPVSGAVFEGWSGSCSGTDPCRLVMDQSHSVGARFAWILEVEVEGEGRVQADPGATTCPDACRSTHAPGTRVTLTPSAAEGSVFERWEGACTGTGPCTVTMDQARSVGAVFVPATVPTFGLAVTVAGDGTGTVSSTPAGISCPGTCSSSYPRDTAVTLQASAAAGSRFDGWTGDCTGAATSCTVTIEAARSVTARFAANPVTPTGCRWAKRIGGPNRDSIASVAIHPTTGRILVSGVVGGDVTVDSVTVSAPSPYGNVFATILDAQGRAQSGFAYGRQGPDLGVLMGGHGAWVGPDRIALALHLSGRLDFGDGQVRQSLPSSAIPSAWRTFLAGYSTAGTPVWVRPIAETSSPTTDGIVGLAADPTRGTITVASHFVSPENFGGAFTYTPAPTNGSAPPQDLFVAQYSADGNLRWVRTAGEDSLDAALGVANGPDGSVAWAGTFRGPIDVGLGAFPATTPFSGLVGTFGSNGTARFARALSPTAGGLAEGRAVAVAANGDVIVAGSYASPLDFGLGLVPASDTDAFVARYTSSGTPVWATRLGGAGAWEIASAVAYDPASDRVWVAGSFGGRTTLGAVSASSTGTDGWPDVFLLRIAGASGAIQRVSTHGEDGIDTVSSLAVDGAGNLLVSGTFSQGIDLNNGLRLAGQGQGDGFVACVSP